MGEPEAGGVLDDWISRARLAEELGVSAETLRNWENRRIGPPLIKLGGRVLYRREAVRAWLLAQEPRAPIVEPAGVDVGPYRREPARRPPS